MSTYTYADSFTRAHARKLAAKVTTDLYQSQLLYGSPSETMLTKYTMELEDLLADGYVSNYQFGFQCSGSVIWSLRYAVGPDGGFIPDVRGGSVPAGHNISEGEFFNFLTFSAKWHLLDVLSRKKIEGSLPFIRSVGSLPQASGMWVRDRVYSSGGVEVIREVFRRTV